MVAHTVTYGFIPHYAPGIGACRKPHYRGRRNGEKSFSAALEVLYRAAYINNCTVGVVTNLVYDSLLLAQPYHMNAIIASNLPCYRVALLLILTVRIPT